MKEMRKNKTITDILDRSWIRQRKLSCKHQAYKSRDKVEKVDRLKWLNDRVC